jgi:D-tyrosyl-tRNA(Tyr) deacylase
VDVDGEVVGEIGRGLLVLLGAGGPDDDSDLAYVVHKIASLRVFEDDGGKMNLSVEDIGGQVLLVSQFTLYGDCRKGRRPSFVAAMHPDQAEPMVDRVVEGLRKRGLRVETGRFGADMDVHLINDGPVTLLVDSKKEF